MNGTIINVSLIFVFGVISLLTHREFTESFQEKLRKVTGALALFLGLVMMFHGFTWSDGIMMLLKQFGIFYLSALLGIFIGGLLRIEKGMAAITRKAHQMFSKSISSEKPDGFQSNKFSEGFQVCTVLFCIGPMAIVGAIMDATTGNFFVLLIKGIMDGISVMAFVRYYGYGAIVSAFPVGVFQGTIALVLMAYVKLNLSELMVDSLHLMGGFLVISMSLVILGAKKVPIANYLPAIIISPLLTYFLLN